VIIRDVLKKKKEGSSSTGKKTLTNLSKGGGGNFGGGKGNKGTKLASKSQGRGAGERDGGPKKAEERWSRVDQDFERGSTGENRGGGVVSGLKRAVDIGGGPKGSLSGTGARSLKGSRKGDGTRMETELKWGKGGSGGRAHRGPKKGATP